jgi:uracil-DNA glycosylase family 4
VNDTRALKELELHAVASLYGLVDSAGALAPPAEVGEAPAAPVVQPVVRDLSATGWDELEALVRSCTDCGLCKQRKQAVFGVGDRQGPWLFVGEGPGADEDEQGEPFVGKAGRLLDSMLAAIGLKRGREVYIANVVKCRPPGNRDPSPEEAVACAAYLDRQIELIKPRLIVALGKVAATRLLGTEASLASRRGRVHRYRDIPVVVMYHPSYFLRSPAEKARGWEDLLFARRTLPPA